MKKMSTLWVAGCVMAAALVLAQEPSPAPSPVVQPNRETIVTRPGGGTGQRETKVAAPPAPTLDPSPRQVAVPGPGGSRGRDSVGAGLLRGVQARDVQPGLARLVLAGGPRTVRTGDVIGSDVVKSIEAGRILLSRALPGGGEAMVVVTFDAGGRGRVRVLYENDPKPVNAPALR